MATNNYLPPYILDLVEARKSKGLTQKALANAIGISNSRQCAVEKGRIKMSARLLEKTCDELGVIIRLLPA